MNKTTLNYVDIFYSPPIVRLVFKGEAEIGIPEIRELIACAEKLSNGKPYVIFSDARNSVTVTHEGRRLARSMKEAPLQRGTAVLVKNTLYRIAAELFNKFDKPEFPYGVFTNEQEALDWLLQLPINNKIESIEK